MIMVNMKVKLTYPLPGTSPMEEGSLRWPLADVEIDEITSTSWLERLFIRLAWKNWIFSIQLTSNFGNYIQQFVRVRR